MKRWPFLLAVTVLLSTLGLIQSLSFGEAVLFKKPFAEFPQTLAGRWVGRDVGISSRVLGVLKVSDYPPACRLSW